MFLRKIACNLCERVQLDVHTVKDEFLEARLARQTGPYSWLYDRPDEPPPADMDIIHVCKPCCEYIEKRLAMLRVIGDSRPNEPVCPA